LQAGQRDEAVRQLGAVLQRDPGNAQALGLLQGPAADSPVISPERAGSPAVPPVPHATPAGADAGKTPHYDWSQAEDELRDVLPAMFVGGGETEDSASAGIDEAESAPGGGLPGPDAQPGAAPALRQVAARRAAALRAAGLRQDVHRARGGGRARRPVHRGVVRR